jgi:hypothetical protein
MPLFVLKCNCYGEFKTGDRYPPVFVMPDSIRHPVADQTKNIWVALSVTSCPGQARDDTLNKKEENNGQRKDHGSHGTLRFEL